MLAVVFWSGPCAGSFSALGHCSGLYLRGSDMDIDWKNGDGVFSYGRFVLFLHAFFCPFHQSITSFFCSSYPGLSLACSGSALCRLVFLHASVLPDALVAGLHGDGDAFISTGERNCRVDIPNPVPSVNPVPGTDFFEFSCQTSCSLVFRETILSNFDNFEGLQLD